ncbi:MAG: hypothetical protein II739_08905, partial [Clostridia bacterium]|nr:hypothetical protein [Clostridia bacterium]
MPFIIIGLIVIAIIVAIVAGKERKGGKPRHNDPDTPAKRAGDRGEMIAANFIARALDKDD